MENVFLSSTLEQQIEREMELWKIPGASFAILAPEQSTLFHSVGIRDESEKKVDDETLFCVASCSKAMTAALFAILATKGLVDFDRPVKSYIPEFRLADPEATEKTTLRDMLCHRTGLGGHDGIWPFDQDYKTFHERFRYLEPSAPYGTVAQYSNVIYGLTGYIAERITGKSWPTLMEEYFFKPLGMHRSSCEASLLAADQNHAMPFQVLDGKLTQLPIWDVDTVAPAASVNTCAKDMALWIHFLLSKGVTAEGVRLISEEIFQDMISPQIIYDDGISKKTDKYHCDGYALGWKSGIFHGHSIRLHTGKIEGYSTIQGFLPELGIGGSIMVNLHSPVDGFTYGFLFTIFEMLLGIPEEDRTPWSELIHGPNMPTAETYLDCYFDILKDRYPESRPMDAKDACRLGIHKKLVGTYFHLGYGHLSIYEKEDQLRLKWRDQDLPLTPHWGNLLEVDGIKEDTMTMRLPVLPLYEEGASASSIQIPLEPMVADISFKRIS